MGVHLHRRSDKDEEKDPEYEAVVQIDRNTSHGSVQWNVPVSMTAEQYAKRRLGVDSSSALKNQRCCLGYDGRGVHLYMSGCERNGSNTAGAGPIYGSANIAAAALARENAARALGKPPSAAPQEHMQEQEY